LDILNRDLITGFDFDIETVHGGVSLYIRRCEEGLRVDFEFGQEDFRSEEFIENLCCLFEWTYVRPYKSGSFKRGHACTTWIGILENTTYFRQYMGIQKHIRIYATEWEKYAEKWKNEGHDNLLAIFETSLCEMGDDPVSEAEFEMEDSGLVSVKTRSFFKMNVDELSLFVRSHWSEEIISSSI